MAMQHHSPTGSQGGCLVVKATKGGDNTALEGETRGLAFTLDKLADAVVAEVNMEHAGSAQEQQL